MVLNNTERGFTLIEIIVVLVLLGIMTAFAGMGMVKIAEGFLFAKQSSEAVQKGQIAITRIEREFAFISAVTSGSQTAISYTHVRSGTTYSHTLSWAGSGSDLLLDGDVLTDRVGTFSIAYRDTYNGAAGTSWSGSNKILEVTLSLTGANQTTVTFTKRVVPRNL